MHYAIKMYESQNVSFEIYTSAIIILGEMGNFSEYLYIDEDDKRRYMVSYQSDLTRRCLGVLWRLHTRTVV